MGLATASLTYQLDSTTRKERLYTYTYDAGNVDCDIEFDCTGLKNVRATVIAGTAVNVTWKVKPTISGSDTYVALAAATALSAGSATTKAFDDGWIKVQVALTTADDDVTVAISGDIE